MDVRVDLCVDRQWNTGAGGRFHDTGVHVLWRFVCWCVVVCVDLCLTCRETLVLMEDFMTLTCVRVTVLICVLMYGWKTGTDGRFHSTDMCVCYCVDLYVDVWTCVLINVLTGSETLLLMEGFMTLTCAGVLLCCVGCWCIFCLLLFVLTGS